MFYVFRKHGIGQSFQSSKSVFNDRKRDYLGNQTRAAGKRNKFKGLTYFEVLLRAIMK